MSDEIYTLALKNTLQEIRNVCPDVTSNFVFKDGEIVAKDKNIDEETSIQTINAFNMIKEKADILGGLEAVTIQGTEGKINIATINDFHLTTVSSRGADEKYVNTLTRVLIPIVIKLVEEIHAASSENETKTNDEATVTLEPRTR
jgi:predicted regulator of Ras-like GTPase activity (Roadblock/LC7/MglB family)